MPTLSLSREGHVAHIRWSNPPHNFIDLDFISQLAEEICSLNSDPDCRVVLLSAEGRVFCAGADFGAIAGEMEIDPAPFYAQAMRLFDAEKPIVAAVHGPAIGAGLGLAMAADFRVAGPATRLSANFVQLGFHPGFGLTHTLPRLIGLQRASTLLYTGRRIDGATALALGVVDELVESTDAVLDRAMAIAQEIAGAAPVALQSTRATLRQDLASEVRAANSRELDIQRVQFRTADFREGILASAQRRAPIFTGT